MPNLSGKVAIVTASTAGIGLAIAKRMARDGAQVCISSRKQANVDRTVAELKQEGIEVFGIQCHVGKAEDRARLLEAVLAKFGKIDILVNNAATNPVFGAVDTTNEQIYDKIMDVNVKAAFFMTLEVCKHLQERDAKGAILFISSTSGVIPAPGLGVYSMSKTAMIGMARVFASEFATSGIRVNVIAPGVIETKFSEALWKDEGASEVSLAQIPMRKFGKPDDVAPMASLLCSDEATFITGETILISGGSASL